MEPAAPPQLESDSSPTAESATDSFATVNRSRFAAIPSLPEAHRTIPVASGAHRLRKILAFAGPGYLVAVGYMDPGNWATDLGGGSKFGYTLLSVILLSNLMAMFLQALSAKLGIATGRDLAQACRLRSRRSFGLCRRLEAALRPATPGGRAHHRTRRSPRSCLARPRFPPRRSFRRYADWHYRRVLRL